MSKMSELDVLFTELGTSIMDKGKSTVDIYKFPTPTYEVIFKENHKGYNYFWVGVTQTDFEVDDNALEITAFTEIVEQFALAIDFEKSQYKCLYKGWEKDYANGEPIDTDYDDTPSNARNPWEHNIQDTNFESFIDKLVDFLMDMDFTNTSVVSQLQRLSITKKE